MPLAPGTRLGAYEITGLLGAGGMGEVYRARDTQLNRDVAIKVLPEAVAGDPERLARFMREAQALAALNHPNIAQVYQAGSSFQELASETAPGLAFIVMELVPGSELSALYARHPMRLPEALAVARQIAAALEAAHDNGIIHRDLKPANIKVRSDGTVKVLDFGLAKAMDLATGSSSGDNITTTSPALTESGIILGTAAYMSPEQARGKTVDRRADIWAFGAVLYEMLAGRRLFEGRGDTVSDMVAAVLRDPIDWTALPRTTPATVKSLLARCLDRDVNTRLQSIGEARVILDEAAMRGETRSVKRGLTRRTRWLAVTGAVIFVAALVLWPMTQPLWPTTEPAQVVPSAPVAAQPIRSIAVLPFVNSSGNQDDEYFADGVTDELIASLGKVPGLRVAARSSAFSFKGQKVEIRDVAQKLGVDSVLEGTVRRSGQRLRVTASLVNAKDGLQVWSNTFENDGSDAFAVQDEVTRAVVTALALQFGGAELQASQAGRTKDPVAHDLYKRGLEAANAAREADLRRALDYFQQAIALDPKFALAHTGLAWTYVFLADAYLSPIEAYPKARSAAQTALAIDDRLSDAHALVAYSTFTVDWGQASLAIAEREFRRALDLDQNSVNTLILVGTYRCFSGQVNEGLDDLSRAARLDPLSPLPPYLRELCDYLGQRYAAVIEDHRRTTAIDPAFAYIESWAGAAHRELGDNDAALREYLAAEKAMGGSAQYGLALTYIRMGRQQDAREVMRRMDEHARTHYVPSISRAIVHANLGDIEGAVKLLEQAIDKREAFMLALRGQPEMRALVNDPRTRQILDRVDAIVKK